MRKTRLPEGGTNLFQEIKAVSAQAQKNGSVLIKLSIGQPSGPALISARTTAARAVESDAEAMHEYQDNGSPGVPDFAERFVAAHLCGHVFEEGTVDYLPIPGIKPMLGLIPLACGEDLSLVATTTNPGYPTPKDWCRYLGKLVFEPGLNSENNFLFDPQELNGREVGLVMTNYPHNPSGAVASREWLENLCSYCESHNIRIFNDAAYAALKYDSDSCLLSEVANQFPDLSWVEAFSASKLIGNGTGWRVGAMVGSPDFIGDIKTIKGNTDSGFVAPMALGALYAAEHDPEIANIADLYHQRSIALCQALSEAGMRLATQPKAGFFTLWQTPKQAFGREIKDARDFNFAMIEKTGIVGVHFGKYIRYSVACVDTIGMADEIEKAFESAEISY